MANKQKPPRFSVSKYVSKATVTPWITFYDWFKMATRKGGEAKSADLYKSYAYYCNDKHEPALPSWSFGIALRIFLAVPRKRVARVGSVYDLTLHPINTWDSYRTPEQREQDAKPRGAAVNSESLPRLSNFVRRRV